MTAPHNGHGTARIHGGTDALGAARFDFSSNSNACGPCPVALAAVQTADASRYPDAGYTRLRQALADLHGVAAWRIVLAASASEFIFRFTAWVRRSGGTRVCLPAMAYGDYAHAAQAWGLESNSTPDAADLVWACEPSSPLGQAHAAWPRWLDRMPETAALQHLVLDRAYAPLRLSGQPGLNAAQSDAVWQLFSPNKALALTGIRAAYAIAPDHAHPAAAALDALAPSWPIGAHGEAMLLAWCQPAAQHWLAQTLPSLRDWKQMQLGMLQALGWHGLESEANFFCARPPAALDLPGLLAFLRGRGIKLRDAASLGLPGWLRLSVQPPAAQQALQAGLCAWAMQTQTGASLPYDFPAQAADPNPSLEPIQ